MGETGSNNSGKKGLYAIIAILSLLVLFLTYKVYNTTETVTQLTEDYSTLENDKGNLEVELQEMLAQYETLNINNEEMSAEILQQKQEITELLDRVKKLNKDDKSLRWEIGKLKKEAGTLRDIMKGYIVTIDSLNQENTYLKDENTNLSTELTTVSTDKANLETKVSSQEDIIKLGSVLTSNQFTAQAIRVKSNGSQKETNRASRAEMVKSCVNFASNNIAKRGKKTIYVRVISPEGLVLDDKNNMGKTFKFNGVTGKYSAKRDFDFDGSGGDICVFHTVNNDLTPGQYVVEVYESGHIIGTTTFDLR